MNEHRDPASRLVPALLLLAVLLTFSVGVAAAHGILLTQSDPPDGVTVPRSPSQVIAKFSEELDTKGSMMIVVDAEGHQVSDGNGAVDLNDPDHATLIAALPAPLVGGVYTVKWHALLTDGDANDGSFAFTVQAMGAAGQVEVTATASPTGAPTVSPTTPPTAAPIMAQPPSDPPGQLPSTGRSTNGLALWSAAAIAGALIILGLGAALRRIER